MLANLLRLQFIGERRLGDVPGLLDHSVGILNLEGGVDDLAVGVGGTGTVDGHFLTFENFRRPDLEFTDRRLVLPDRNRSLTGLGRAETFAVVTDALEGVDAGLVEGHLGGTTFGGELKGLDFGSRGVGDDDDVLDILLGTAGINLDRFADFNLLGRDGQSTDRSLGDRLERDVGADLRDHEFVDVLFPGDLEGVGRNGFLPGPNDIVTDGDFLAALGKHPHELVTWLDGRFLELRFLNLLQERVDKPTVTGLFEPHLHISSPVDGDLLQLVGSQVLGFVEGVASQTGHLLLGGLERD